MNKKIIGILAIATLAKVFTASYGYSILSQPNQTGNTANTPFPTPPPTPELTPPSPSETPTEPASIPKQSVPEFTVTFVDYSYDVPPTYGINQFTGETVMTQAGKHVENKSIVFTIKNQPFTHTSARMETSLAYTIRFALKGSLQKIGRNSDTLTLQALNTQ